LYSDRFSLSSHITAFTETWLKPDILSCEVFPSSYTTYRHDRPTQHGGGVFIAVDSDLTSDILILEEKNDIEFLGITLSEFPIYANHLSAIQNISNKLLDRDQLIVLGHFNRSKATWYTVETSNILLLSAQHDCLIFQVNHVQNILGRYYCQNLYNYLTKVPKPPNACADYRQVVKTK